MQNRNMGDRKDRKENKKAWKRGCGLKACIYNILRRVCECESLPEATVLMAPSCPMMYSFSLLSRGNLRLSAASRRACTSWNCTETRRRTLGKQMRHSMKKRKGRHVRKFTKGKKHKDIKVFWRMSLFTLPSVYHHLVLFATTKDT